MQRKALSLLAALPGPGCRRHDTVSLTILQCEDSSAQESRNAVSGKGCKLYRDEGIGGLKEKKCWEKLEGNWKKSNTKVSVVTLHRLRLWSCFPYPRHADLVGKRIPQICCPLCNKILRNVTSCCLSAHFHMLLESSSSSRKGRSRNTRSRSSRSRSSRSRSIVGVAAGAGDAVALALTTAHANRCLHMREREKEGRRTREGEREKKGHKEREGGFRLQLHSGCPKVRIFRFRGKTQTEVRESASQRPYNSARDRRGTYNLPGDGKEMQLKYACSVGVSEERGCALACEVV